MNIHSYDSGFHTVYNAMFTLAVMVSSIALACSI